MIFEYHNKVNKMKNLTSIIAVAMTTIAVETVNAQYHQKAEQNPYTWVYGGAITENVKGKVNVHPLTYKLNGIDRVANGYTPANYDASEHYPAVVVAHPNGGIKPQTA